MIKREIEMDRQKHFIKGIKKNRRWLTRLHFLSTSETETIKVACG